MKESISKRYSRTIDGKYIIDITAGSVSDLYNSFDRHTPYSRKELDQGLVEYITDSASELGNNEFTIQIDLLEPPDESMKDRIRTSISSYFLYLKTIELNQMGRKMRVSLIYLAIGIVILYFSVYVNRQLASDTTVLMTVFSEGLTVAAWVSLWEALATFLVNWTPYRRKIKLYQYIASSPVVFINSKLETQ